MDTNVIVYAATHSDYQPPCAEMLAEVAEGNVDGRTSVAVLEELWHLELRGALDDLIGITAEARVLFAPVLSVTDEIFGRALALEVPQLGANDRVHAATCLVLEIPIIVSADRDFDSVRGLRRVDPLDQRAMRRVLTN